MTDLTALAAQRCTELANAGSGNHRWDVTDFTHGVVSTTGYVQFVEQAHHLATAVVAKHPDLADELKPMILVEPVDAVEELSQQLQDHCESENGISLRMSEWNAIAAAAIRLYRQREGGSNGQ